MTGQSTGLLGYDISNDNSTIQEAFAFYAQHLVGLGLLAQPLGPDGNPKGRATCFFKSGFIMEFGRARNWYWVTAGHVIQGIETDVKKGQAETRDFRLIDSYGLGAVDTNPVPFDFDGAWKHAVVDDEAGLDFGVVELRAIYKESLRRNGIVPVRVKDWRNLDEVEFEGFFILGLPDDTIVRSERGMSDGYVITGRAPPSAISVHPMARPPKELETTHPRYIGKINKKWPAGSIVGASGGPVIGIVKGYGSQRVIAVQSGWLKTKRITFACPLQVIGPMIQAAIRSR